MAVHHVAVVILNFNSDKDLKVCAEQIARQEGIRLSIILVDNGSCATSLNSIKEWLARWRPNTICGTEDEVRAWIGQHPDNHQQSNATYLVINHKNIGYSAGNNIGIRLADEMQADAVLIANPDMRIDDRLYVKVLLKCLLADPHNYIAASRVIDLQGRDQNPLRELGFCEELLWPLWFLRKFHKPVTCVLPWTVNEPTIVQKVSGCCFMLSAACFRESSCFDENVFLYCEEPILAAKIRLAGGNIVYVPSVTATHAHILSEKGNNALRMLQFIRSRKYYLETYSGYSWWQVRLLSLSYSILSAYYRIESLGA